MTSSLRMLALSCGGLLIATGVAIAQQLSVDINRISESGVGEKVGTVVVKEGKGGVSFKVSAKGVPKGPHGFHVHDKGECAAASKDGKMMAGFAAGPHYDPAGTKSHKGPKGGGHKGDLPVLNASEKGINQTVTAPQLKLADLRGRALMIHEGGDNYTDTPENGGGAGRIACGVVPKG
jgi:superoxide dismutase, Cu-Zn family